MAALKNFADFCNKIRNNWQFNLSKGLRGKHSQTKRCGRLCPLEQQKKLQKSTWRETRANCLSPVFELSDKRLLFCFVANKKTRLK